MTRKEAEQAIYEHMVSIRKIARKYAPQTNYLDLNLDEFDGKISFNNNYWEIADEQEIRFLE